MEFQQDTLFGKKVISTIGYNEQEMIQDILFLHADGKMIDCDPTYSKGNFYKDWAIKPKHKFDKFPSAPDVIEATSDNLPLDNESINTLMFDPPFVIHGNSTAEVNKGSCIINERFTGFKDWGKLKLMYSLSLKEFYRILRNEGVIIFKCQDTVSSGKNHFSHVWIMNEALKIGFYPKDLFILLARNRLNDGRVQQHARKYHCYFWVFKKQSCGVNY